MDTKAGKGATSDLATGSDEVAPRRRYYRDAQKRQIVEESMIAGASVAQVALRHGINANLLFTWRKQMQRDASATLLPVQVVDAPAPVKLPSSAMPAPVAPPAPSCIEIELASGHRVRVHGAADERTVRSIIEALSR